jgi:hypothetical protein
MSAFAADICRFPVRHAKVQSAKIMAQTRFAVGGVILAGGTFYNDPDMRLVRSGVGTYNMTFPASQGRVYCHIELLNFGASPNVAFMYMTAVNPSAGTATLVTTAVGAPFTPVDNTDTNAYANIELTIDQKKPN